MVCLFDTDLTQGKVPEGIKMTKHPEKIFLITTAHHNCIFQSLNEMNDFLIFFLVNFFLISFTHLLYSDKYQCSFTHESDFLV